MEKKSKAIFKGIQIGHYISDFKIIPIWNFMLVRIREKRENFKSRAYKAFNISYECVDCSISYNRSITIAILNILS